MEKHFITHALLGFKYPFVKFLKMNILGANWKYVWFVSFWDKKLGVGRRRRKYHIFKFFFVEMIKNNSVVEKQ